MNFFDKLDKYGDNIALITETSKTSYRQLNELTDNIKKRIKQSSLVFLICKNCLESIVGYLGFLRAGATVALIDDKIHVNFLTKLLETYRPSYIFLPEEKCDNCPRKFKPVFSLKGYTLLQTDFQIDYTLNKNLALLLTTSGTTGTPKFVRQSFKNINNNAEIIAQYLKISSEDRPITTMPMSYTYGLSIINSHLCVGASIILTDTTIMEKRFWELLKDFEATTFGGVPYTYEMLKRICFDKMNLPNLKYLTQAGGKLNKELSIEFTKLCLQKGMKFFTMYGQTEATARMSYLPWEYAITKAGSIGIAIPGGIFQLRDEKDKLILENDKAGELVYFGNNVVLGYAENRFDLAKGDENQGVLYTGDVAKRDSDGFYYIVGRKKRFLKLFGRRINLDETEQILRKVEDSCICSGEDDCLRIYVTQTKYIPELKNIIINQLGINSAGFVIRYLDNVPRNKSGKILYSKLEESANQSKIVDLNKLMEIGPFSLAKIEKEKLYTQLLGYLNRHHYFSCRAYHRIIDRLGFDFSNEYSPEETPFIPVRLFKDYELLSVERSKIVKTMTSSGTTGQKASQIFLDAITASNQTKALSKIVSDFIGTKRLPLLIIDTQSVLKNRNLFSARGAGILGFSIFGKDITYALNERMELDFDLIDSFCKKHQGEKILIFGFTSLVWEYLYQRLTESNRKISLENGILIHGGGWKKLTAQAVNNDFFKRSIKKACGIRKIHNYYGMVEQTGSIFMECEAGHLHCSIFSDIIIRDTDFSICDLGKKGLIESISLLPYSYPGQAILSEDLGEISGEDDCPCGRLGKYFKVRGRIKKAELRGCSDTYG